MLVIPAIDLKDGQAVRLFKGDYNQKTVYSDKPEKLAQDFETMGAKLLHVVDLDGAKDGKCINLETIKKIKQNTSMQIELGGGIRNLETVALYLDEVGIDRVILGTAAINDPEFLKNALCTYGAERIVVGVDVKDGYVSTSGWLETSAVPYLEFIKDLEKLGVKYIVATDISKDGTLQGPNFEMYEQITKTSKINFVVSGGIKDAQNIKDAANKDYYACIVGKAYYEGRVDLKEVIACLQNG
ncbi:1-(5-phosphoribosyl)-5-[(5-phosphoribosylamino)methylideneamino]imidazole-4-carboxamide isomerase [Thomasclavelia cocleata]|jgi:phosphoribosylformimino-5-aminoimidazole carboxamide ribotide isomerase|uniref:1-(5-phosphoribosyl)-5-[(5-phosphoribosylamino)methylideneamino] imidazole-4-carboxamide isomerase n=2 Tax=Thomasclavelia cocleata TaxID=69824 RepID=A0A1I0D4N0_9FIRM|nr:1-(5-phosphoribosyl)-5-[(5-phosphoribosylamino)methylideneamino]imidazole-4-carboxamide isomerase [Thomasclavelia cocleata]MCR1960490.1 1-(5-phosphoribosyl)-5-[(5-phosphoribosylamino)methylideneamino]imidazole-4-carboxamide isomerase [Thomasclavelia cocleata]NDO42027.1 1-(5-phosphoribosyl)-5-[(5-phosphoribosylamino)methylideneamino]imidazole-4-carboxamide isomerase [Thomasclavelia cocleata]PJN80942.1 1-(5-phosphoribosyl)-5-[(5-phosphoribosylamino)methylideneamino]imidazole-4-carboxamide isome